MKKALEIMERSSFTFLEDSEVGKGPNSNKRAFLALERLGYATSRDEGFGVVWRLTDAGQKAHAVIKARTALDAANAALRAIPGCDRFMLGEGPMTDEFVSALKVVGDAHETFLTLCHASAKV